MRNGELSFWMARDNLEAPVTSPLDCNQAVDVAIVGGGLTGLWAAWALATSDPSLSISVYEAERLGHGASGRNGGWLSAKPVGLREVLRRHGSGRDGVVTVERLLEESMHDVVRILGPASIDATYGGWLQVARSLPEQRRLEANLANNRSWGLGEERLRLLTAEQVRERVAVDKAVGALYSPHNYRVDPAKMLLTLARTVQQLGVRIYTDSPVVSIKPGRLLVKGHTIEVERRTVVATEGYTSLQKDQRRRMLPLNSAMLVTEPLTADEWQGIGWHRSEGLSGAAHTYFYGQRTADGRIAIGGRGKPYRFASGFDHLGEVDAQTVTALEAVLREIFPQVQLRAAHAWCGVLGVTRDWSPFVEDAIEDRITRAGGYAGQGLAASHLVGRIIAALILKPNSDLTTMPWVRPSPRKWEPEPFRWIGANGLYRAYSTADWIEAHSNSGRTSGLAVLADRIAGR